MSYGDLRVAERSDWLIERVATAGTLVLRRISETRAGEPAVHRFLSSPYASVERIVETLAVRTAQQCSGLTLVEAREVDAPANKTPLLWRPLKSDGLKLDDSQIVDAERMFNLAAIGLAAAIRTIQLVDARSSSRRPATDVIDAATFAAALQRLCAKLEGKTERQKNPHPPDSLAFVAWIAARLGGWNCCCKPPGPKTMRQG